MTASFFGKYRGVVVGNVDPFQIGRVQVSVPAVLGSGRASWAMPCVPYAGDGVGMFLIPPVDANVWVEFEGGDPDSPIWVGGFWGRGETPASPAVADLKVLKTKTATITIDEKPGSGSVTVELTGGGSMKFSSQGIKVTTGQGATIELSGPKVSINDGALEVQ